jgi:hypothetical protein
MIAMLLIIVALVFDSHTLFVRTLPSDMGKIAKEITAWGMAIAFELTVLHMPVKSVKKNTFKST